MADPLAILNGKYSLTNNGEYPCTLSYSCKNGFSSRDTMQRDCVADGTFTGTAPTCVGIPCEAVPPAPMASIRIGNGGRYPSIATYSCDEGYTTADSLTRRCRTNGTWTRSAPTCSGVPCTSLPPVLYGAFATTNFNRYPSVATFSCKRGYVLSDINPRYCKKNGRWSRKAPTCEPILCPKPSAVFMADVVVTSSNFPSTADYVCQRGYRCKGNCRRKCTADGGWTGVNPVCVGITCKAVPKIANGVVSLVKGVYPCSANVVCSTGYRLKGQSQLFARTDGTWPSPGLCEPISCPTITTFENGNVRIDRTKAPQTLTYACQAGFDFVAGATDGKYVRECSVDAQWTRAEPTCVGVLCADPVSIGNGTYTLSSSRYPATLNYKCSPGYNIRGVPRLKCMPGGSWSGPAPKCVPSSCRNPADIMSPGKVTTTSNVFPSKAVYSCPYGFKLVGDSERVCKEDGTWAGYAPRCEAMKSCLDKPCQANSVCKDQSGASPYICVCPSPFFQGTWCEQEANFMKTNGGITKMNSGQYLRTTNKKFFMMLSRHGELAIFRGDGPTGPGEPSGEKIWTNGFYTVDMGYYTLTLESNGRFAVYQATFESYQPIGQPVWSAPLPKETAPETFRAVLSNAGQMVLIRGTTKFWETTKP